MRKKVIYKMDDVEKAYAIRVANEKHLITAREAALLLGLSERTIYKYIQQGYIKEGVIATRLQDNSIRILRDELYKLVEKPLHEEDYQAKALQP